MAAGQRPGVFAELYEKRDGVRDRLRTVVVK
jgi:hypothetical protein